ncbi:MAG: hypothetical protein U0793_18225 [Gemmataceae bacterium]
MNLAVYYHLPLLIVLISLVYSATRYEEWPSICHEALRWGLRMALFLVSIGAVIWVVDAILWPRG